MVTLGVSVYPEQETLEQIDEYLKLASSYGFSKVFTSMFSVPGEREEIKKYFTDFSNIAHKYNMKVSGDCNGMFFEKMGATEKDLTVFKEMGIDIIRMDFSFGDERDAVLINNDEGIEIEMSAAFTQMVDTAIKYGADVSRISSCHNFYPQKYTAPSLETINGINDDMHKRGVDVAIFISSREEGTHGPWPVSDGLPTIEEHRNLPIEVQLKHCLAMKNVEEVRIGNAFASEAEFKAIADVMKLAYVDVNMNSDNPMIKMIIDYLPKGPVERIPFKVNLEEGISDIEKEIMFNFPLHCDMGDCLNYMLRSRMTRMIYGKEDIPERKCEKTHYTRGDVVIVNDNLKHYRGEVQIVLKDIEVDGQRNLVGRIVDEELFILDYIKAQDIFTFEV